ncbi:MULTISPECIES: HAD family hydrolase [Neorhizobium]|jgi:putative hydrolase of the HAD superfamily|uniref:HAD family hydrolase n=1 Tax=Neorhizobium sp. T6_25 TaxID=2093833 RepID=UPI000CF9929B|nr:MULTISPECIES: HAD family hydrolase [Neorhizobium]
MKVFFDVDGVLIDGWHADVSRRKPWDATIEADLGVDRQAFQTLFFGAAGTRASSRMAECVKGRADLKLSLAEVLPQTGYKGNVDDFVRYWFEKDSNVQTEVVALAAILKSQNLRTFVATGQEHHRAHYLWHELRFSDYFERLFYSAEIGLLKKDTGFFEAINRALDIHPEERPLFFDDQPEIVDLAKGAGWDAVTFNSVEDIKKHPRLKDLLG